MKLSQLNFTLIVALIFSSTALVPSNSVANDKETMRLLDQFGDVFEKIREEYVEKPSDKELIEAAINGMLTDLDPHSSYMTKEDFDDMRTQTRGSFGGLGIEITMKNGLVYIVSPIDDTPAFKAGLQSGDYISHINSEAVMGMKIKDAVKKMRGKPKTEITLTIIREGADEPFDVTFERDIINIKSVKSNIEEDDIIYLRVSRFTEQTTPALIKEIKKQKEELGDKVKGVVLDLRNNPGGLLDQAIGVSNVFLERGEIVSTRGRIAKSIKRFNATKGDLAEGRSIVVLINGGSASASEIVAGALQDHKRAVIMGTQSFGKGSVQTIIPVPNDSAIRLTTSRYYTPSGNSIQAKGIEPDIIVELAKIEFLKKRRRTTEANLRGHINDGNDKKDTDSADKSENQNDKDDDDNQEKEDTKVNPEDLFGEKEEEKSLYQRDYQLARAIDFLHGIYVFSQRDEMQNPKNITEE